MTNVTNLETRLCLSILFFYPEQSIWIKWCPAGTCCQKYRVIRSQLLTLRWHFLWGMHGPVLYWTFFMYASFAYGHAFLSVSTFMDGLIELHWLSLFLQFILQESLRLFESVLFWILCSFIVGLCKIWNSFSEIAIFMLTFS